MSSLDVLINSFSSFEEAKAWKDLGVETWLIAESLSLSCPEQACSVYRIQPLQFMCVFVCVYRMKKSAI